MQIGLITQLHGSPEGDSQAPSWDSIKQLALCAEAVGFDMFVFEDGGRHCEPYGARLLGADPLSRS